MGSEVKIALVKHTDRIKQLVDLFSAAFKEDMPEEFWHWKYLQNPLASPDSEVVVALDGDKIVGARPFMLAKMWLGNEEVKVAEHTNTMVHPSYQRQGIFNKMGKFAIQWLREEGFALSYGFPVPRARPGFLSQGYRIVAEQEKIFRAVNPRKLVFSQMNNKWLGKSVSFLYEGLANFKRREKSTKSSLFQFITCDKVTDEVAEVYATRGNSKIDLVRDESYLRWRFDHHPKHRYNYVLAKSGGRLLGYAVTSVQVKAKGVVFGTIVDHVVKDSDIACYQALISQCLERLQEQECDILSILTIGEPELRRELLQHFCFKSSAKFPYSRFSSYNYMDVLQLDERVGERIDIYDENNWRVTDAFINWM